MSDTEILIRRIQDSHSLDLRKQSIHELVEAVGSDAIEILLPLLNDLESEIREATLEELGKVGNDAIGRDLLPLLTDSSWDVREAATSAICRIGGSQTVQELTAMFGQQELEWDIEKNVFRILGEIGEPHEIMDTLLNGLNSPQEFVRKTAVEALANTGESHILEHLIRMSEDESAYVRNAAMDAMGKYTQATLSRHILPALQSGNEQEREQSLKALETLTQQQVTLLTEDGSVENKAAMIEALGHIGNDTSVNTLLQVLGGESDPKLKLASIEALGETRHPAALEALSSQLNNPSVDIRRATAQSLKQMDLSEAIPMLIQALDDRDLTVSEHALEALLQTPNPLALSPLLRHLEKELSEDAQLDIIRAIAAMDTPEATESLFQLAGQESQYAHLETLEDILSDRIASTMEALEQEITPDRIQQLESWPVSPNQLHLFEPWLPFLLTQSQPEVKKLTHTLMKRMVLVPFSILYQAFQQSEDDTIRESIFLSMLEFCSLEDILEVFEPHLFDPTSNLRDLLTEAISQQPLQAQRLFMEMLDHPATPVQRSALQGIKKNRMEECLPQLLALTENAPPELQPVLIETLGTFNTPEVVRALVNIQQTHPSLAELVKTQMEFIADINFSVLKEFGNHVSESLLESLKPLMSEARTDDLLPLLKHRDLEIREMAANLVLPYPTEPVLRALVPFLSTESPELCQVVRESLNASQVDLFDEMAHELKHTSTPENILELLVTMQNPKALSIFLDAMRDPEKTVADLSVDGLAGIGEVAIAPLVDILEAEKTFEIRQRAVKALIKIGPACIPELIRLLENTDTVLEKSLRIILVQVGKRDVPQLLKYLETSSDTVRIHLIYALGRIRDSSALSKIGQYLDNSTQEIRQAAMDALSRFQPEGLHVILERTLDSLPLEDVIEAAKILQPHQRHIRNAFLAKMESTNQSDILLRLFQMVKILKTEGTTDWVIDKGLQSEERSLQLAAIEALGELKAESAIDILCEKSRTADPEILVAILTTLGHIAHPRSLPTLFAFKTRPEPDIRAKVVWAVSQIEDEQVVPFLLDNLSDPSELVRQATLKSLAAIPSETAIQALLEYIPKEQDENILDQLVPILIQTRHKEALPALLSLLEILPSVDTLSQIITYLGKTAYLKASTQLLSMLSQEASASLRPVIIVALAKMSTPDSRERILPFLESEHWKEQRAALEALGHLGKKEDLLLLESWNPRRKNNVKDWVLRSEARASSQILTTRFEENS